MPRACELTDMTPIDRGQQNRRREHQREEDPRAVSWHRGEDGDAENHRADVLGRGRLEEVGATAGAVADVVAHQVGDDRRVARVVLGDAGLDLADEVGADVGGLGVDAAAKLGEQRDEAGAEAKADDQKRRGRRMRRTAVDRKSTVTPSKLSATTRKPETAPPRRAVVIASLRLCRAALAVRIFERTATYMPMKPDNPEASAPTRKAIAVRTPRWASRSTAPISARSTEVTSASNAIVVYCRRRKAIAPW